MDTRNKHEGSALTIMEAVETLSSIADMDIDAVMNLVNHPELIDENQTSLQRVVQWLRPGDMGATVESVRDTFKIILHYLRNFYKKEYGYSLKPETTESIKSIMVLVGEAAKKLDRYTELFQHKKTKSVTELKEYRRLQEFYLSRIAHKVDESTLGKWLIALTQRMMTSAAPVTLEGKQASLSKHVFVDLDSVKKDSEYELFFIRKEDGTRFFSPRLIRNIKLVCDFGESLTEVKMDDPLESVSLWREHHLNSVAAQLLKKAAPLINDFYHELSNASGELGENVSKSIMALMICAEPHTIMHDPGLKGCAQYFKDFLYFLRLALNTREYQKLVAYSAADKHSVFMLNIVNTLCHALFYEVQLDENVFVNIINLVHEAVSEVSTEHRNGAAADQVWSHIANDNAALTKLLKQHASGPLIKVLNLLEDGSYNVFDSLWQDNTPYQLFNIHADARKVSNINMPSPTYQEFINKVSVTEEFKAALRLMMARMEGEHHLLINLQDRTSWKEHARCVALEDLQKLSDFSNQITVVTLAKDTEFYHQLPPYTTENHANVFIETFKKQILDENTGYYFPNQLKEMLEPQYIDDLMHAIHRVFFSGKNVLSRDARLDFIEICYAFLELKLIELVKPTSMSFTCKDGVDVGSASNAELFGFLRLLNPEPWTQKDFDHLSFLLYTNPIMIRERIIMPERFVRLQSTMKAVEKVKNEFGAANFQKIINEVFGRFFKSSLLTPSISFVEHENAWLKVA